MQLNNSGAAGIFPPGGSGSSIAHDTVSIKTNTPNNKNITNAINNESITLFAHSHLLFFLRVACLFIFVNNSIDRKNHNSRFEKTHAIRHDQCICETTLPFLHTLVQFPLLQCHLLT